MNYGKRLIQAGIVLLFLILMILYFSVNEEYVPQNPVKEIGKVEMKVIPQQYVGSKNVTEIHYLERDGYKADIPELEIIEEFYHMDKKIHKRLTEESAVELVTFVASLEFEGKPAFPDITPELLLGQIQIESSFFIDVTSKADGTGSHVGLSQSSGKWNIDNVNKWAFLADGKEVSTKEEAREKLLKYPVLNVAVQAQQLQDYFTRYRSMENPEELALMTYRYGNIDNGDTSGYVAAVEKAKETYKN